MKKASANSEETKSGVKPSGAPAAVPTPRTLAVDVGGTGIKALTLDPAGKPLNERTRLPTPKHATPKALIGVIRELAKAQDGFERVSVGFPGVVKDGIIYTAVNLGKGWEGYDLRHALEEKLKRPVEIANDADIQGLGCTLGKGIELVITLGTGFGSVVFTNGTRIHLELGHHPFHKGKTYEDELSERALKKKGRKRWNKMLAQAIDDLRRTFNFDRLYIGGGNSRLVDLKLPPDVKLVSNEDGLLGGIALWHEATPPGVKASKAKPGLTKKLGSRSAKSKVKAAAKSAGMDAKEGSAPSEDNGAVSRGAPPMTEGE